MAKAKTVDIDNNDFFIEMECTLAEEARKFFYATLSTHDKPVKVSAMNVFERIGLEINPRDWMYSLVDYFDAHKKELSNRVSKDYISRVQPREGNHLFSDVLFCTTGKT